MTKALAFPDKEEINMIMEYCKVLAQAPAYQSFGGLPGVFATVMTARELNIPVMMGLNGGLWPIATKGAPPRIVLAAQTMNMMILRAGHDIEQIYLDDEKCTLKGTRKDTGRQMTVTFTFEMATKAGLTHHKYDTQYSKKGSPKFESPWFTQRQPMLWKSALSQLARRLYADVIGNCFGEADFNEELEEVQLEEGFSPFNPETDKKLKTNRKKQKVTESLETKAEILLPVHEEKQTLEDFVKEYDLRNENSPMNKYLNEIAAIKEIDFEKILTSAFDRKDQFLEKYQEYRHQLLVSEENETIDDELSFEESYNE